MKTFTSVLIFTVSFFISGEGFSQGSELSLSLYGGYSLPTEHLIGFYQVYYVPPGKLSGYNIGASANYYPTKEKHLSLTGSLSFNSLSSTNNFHAWTEGTGKANAKINIVSVNTGVQYKFLRSAKINPFASIELSSNFYTGHTVLSDFNFENTGGSPETYELRPAFRLGLQLGAGLEINVSKKIAVITGCKFSFSNLIGRSGTVDYYETGYSLQDGINSDYNEVTQNVFYSQFYTGISFYPGTRSFLVSSKGFSQSTWSLSLMGGYSYPTANLRGEQYRDAFNSSYYLKNGFNLGFKSTQPLTKNGYINLSEAFQFNSFTNSPEYDEDELNIQIASFNVGLQYNFTPETVIDPFLALYLTNNFISGSMIQRGITVGGPDHFFTAEYRGGLQFGAGTSININKNFAYLFGVNYEIVNLIGKKYNTTRSEYSALNDGSHYLQVANEYYSDTKMIAYFQFYTGISFYPGRF